jgi:hypothetical protein
MESIGQPRKLKRAWTTEDDEQLRTLAPKISPVRLAVRLKRTKSAVVDRAFKLGVKLATQRNSASRMRASS